MTRKAQAWVYGDDELSCLCVRLMTCKPLTLWGEISAPDSRELFLVEAHGCALAVRKERPFDQAAVAREQRQDFALG